MDKKTRIGYRMVLICAMGMLLLNYPILSGPNSNELLLGIPVLYLYVFIVWFVLVLLIYIGVNRIKGK
ncbi:hypothetical protein [Olivibacter sitiensis]|uniref:hypothetical protein n=1 Tax=Olivibacter sitiensis TaxID=376470 RepID=UPI0004222113|nr:hypothetical protein [Olivibacter sitiensis]